MRLILPAGLIVYFVLAVTSMRSKASVFDESAHLPSGYTYLTLRDFRMNPEHPPLVKELAALPLLLMDVKLRTEGEAWALHRQWEFGSRFLYQWNDADRLLFWGRLPIVGLGCALAAAVFLWTKRRFGPLAGTIALLLCVLSPDVLAHGQIVTTDVAIALFIFLTVIAFQAVTERVTLPRVLIAGLAAGAACASKFSAPVLAPMLGALAVGVAVSRDPMPVAIRGETRMVGGTGRKLAVLAVALVAMAIVALVVVWATYGFHGAAAPGFEWSNVEPSRALPKAAVTSLRRAHVVPEPFLFGLLRVYRHSEARPAFLFGRVSDRGWWYYFPATFALKTPLALLALLLLPHLARAKLGGGAQPFLWLPVLVYAVATLTRSLNIGHRHLLPIYPFLFAAAGRAAASVIEMSRRGRAAVFVLCAWYAVSVLRVHPHYLGYFNELVGGPSRGWRYLVDSNLDWGQDLKALKRWTVEHGVAHLKLSYFGTADPAYYAIPCELLPSYTLPPRPMVGEVRAGEVVAVSATNLQGVYMNEEWKPLMARLRALTPVDRVGYSIFIFEPDFSASVPIPEK
jgi:4-amino-4-deoxy-L-arabinose transferase-like glycosyltransferase